MIILITDILEQLPDDLEVFRYDLSGPYFLDTEHKNSEKGVLDLCII